MTSRYGRRGISARPRLELAEPAPELLTFNRAFITGREHRYIQEAIDNLHISGGGPFSDRSCGRLRELIGAEAVFLTHSATGALELAVMLAGIGAGSEVIMPSFTFPSTAAAFVLRGAVPVFVDISDETLNLDVGQVKRAISSRTRAVVPVHYAGVGADMDELCDLALERGLAVIEDAAQALGATYRGRPLGCFGAMAAVSFHETKNVTCGEGGALVLNDPTLVDRAEVLYEKGTDRRKFARREVEQYRWVDIGSSFTMSEIAAAFLWAQLESIDDVNRARLEIWNAYHRRLEPLEAEGLLRRPIVPDDRQHNGHSYYILLGEEDQRASFIDLLGRAGIEAVSHYVPLHDSPAGRRFGRSLGDLPVTQAVARRLVRLPLWVGMTADDVQHIVRSIEDTLPRRLARAG
jgi:dTDP-4-amino-4,6-dideoxygalactose transaminase